MPINLRALSVVLVLAGAISSPLFAATQQDNSSELLLRGAKKWVEKDRSDLAKTLLQKVLLIEPASPEALSMLGKIALKNGKPDEAQRYLNALQQTAPDNARTHELKSAYRLATGTPLENRPAPALKTEIIQKNLAAQSITVKPKPVVASKATKLKPVVASTTSNLKPQTHSKVTKLIATKPPHENEISTVPAETEINLTNDPDIIARTDALDAMADGNLDLAETSLQDILKRRPQDAEVLGGLGLIRQRRGNPAEAESWFEQALQAAQAVKGETGRWEDLLEMARFWKNLKAANILLDENKLPEAEAAIRQALALKPGYPDALAVLGNIKSAENNLAEAEPLYREALKTEGYNVSAIYGLTSLLSSTQRNPEALELIEQVLRDYPAEWTKKPDSKASILREEARLYVEAGRPSQAIKALEMAVLADPKNAWVRFSLARLYISLDLAPLGRRVVQEGVQLAPDDAEMLHVRALVLLNLDDYAGGIASLNQIPETSLTSGMRETRTRALIKYYFQQAEQKFAQGNRKEAIRIMSVAETQARGDFAATEQVAEGWFSLGLQKQGLSAMRKLPQPAPLGTQVYWASLLNRAKQDQELAEYLPSLRIPEGMDDTNKEYRASIQEIEFSMAGRYYEKLMKAGKTEQAQQFADTILDANQLSTADYFKFHRSYFSRAQLPENAIALLNQEKEQFPDDPNLRYDLAYAYYQDKQNSNAQREIQELLAITKADDIDMRLRIASLQQNTGDDAGARQTVHDLTTRFPNNTEALFEAGNMARANGKYDQAMRYYQQTKEQVQRPATPDKPQKVAVQKAPPDILLNLLPAKASDSGRIGTIAPALVSTKESESIYRSAIASDGGKEKLVASGITASVDRAMNSISAQRSVKIEAGLDIQSKTASSGTSTYNSTEIPLLVRFPIGYEAHGTLQVDKVDVDAGALPVAFNDSALFGKIQAYQAPQAQPLQQNASGASIGLGYEQASVKADIGVVGQGFLVSNVVGGIRTGGDFGRLSYSLTLSRRPYTGSLLSYAGATDPITGAVWGGVTNTGLSLYMSSTLGEYNVSGMSSYGLLRGQNVLNNDRLYLRAAIDRDVYTTDDTVLNIGLSANYTSFAKNQGYYTFGHGGYYSPQSSLSISLPIELSGRADLLSYQLRASVSYARSKEDSAVFYPTDPVLQAQAAAGPSFPPGNSQAIYKGGTGGGLGYGLRLATEYRVTPNFAFGGRFNMDRSAFYAPNSLLFYGRYMFNPETGPVKLRPDPVIPYSQY